MNDSESSGGTVERGDRRETIIGWIVVSFLVAMMFVMAGVHIAIFGLRYLGRYWDYRTTPQIPAQAYSSTRPSSGSTEVEKQVQLPPQKGKAK